MPRFLQSLAAFALAATVALALAACGEEDAQLLPGETAREITANLETVQQLSDEGDCVGAENAAQQVSEQIEGLEGVDQKLKRALEDGAERLEEVIAECDEASAEAIAPATPSEPLEDEEEPAKDKDDEEKEEKAEPDEEDDPDTPTGSPALPPQANGKAKGLEEGEEPPPADEAPEDAPGETPSGGVSPASPAGGGE